MADCINKFWFTCLLLMLLCVSACAETGYSGGKQTELLRIAGNKAGKFFWPCYIRISGAVKKLVQEKRTVYFLVFPNNSGFTDDRLDAHEAKVIEFFSLRSQFLDSLDMVVMMPAFPRPYSRSQLYTHALDRDCLLEKKGSLARLDLQLRAMINDARNRLEKRGWSVAPRVLMWGFSASGMFVNRFALLHPDLVLAAAVGAPGGWPVAPVSDWKGRFLPYPVGIGDLRDLTGREPDINRYRKIPHFFFLGAEDRNDSVTFRDGYSAADQELVFSLFGDSPLQRWNAAKRLYKSAGVCAEFKIYEGVSHTPVPALKDSMGFLIKVRDQSLLPSPSRSTGT